MRASRSRAWQAAEMTADFSCCAGESFADGVLGSWEAESDRLAELTEREGAREDFCDDGMTRKREAAWRVPPATASPSAGQRCSLSRSRWGYGIGGHPGVCKQASEQEVVGCELARHLWWCYGGLLGRTTQGRETVFRDVPASRASFPRQPAPLAFQSSAVITVISARAATRVPRPCPPCRCDEMRCPSLSRPGPGSSCVGGRGEGGGESMAWQRQGLKGEVMAR